MRAWGAALLLALASVAAKAQAPVRIGVLSEDPGSLLAARMAVEDLGGSVRGRKIDVVGADASVAIVLDRPSAAVVRSIEESALQADRAVLIIGMASDAPCSPVTTDWADAPQKLPPGDFAAGFYWNQNETAELFSKRFSARGHARPTSDQALIYTAIVHYVRAIAVAGTDDAAAVNRAMRARPFQFFGNPAHLRADGRAIYDERVWRPGPSPDAPASLLRTIPAQSAFAGCTCYDAGKTVGIGEAACG